MHITCPSCSATFKVDADALDRAGRKVRCGRCGHSWREAPAAAAPAAAPPPAAAEPDPYAPPPPSPHRRQAEETRQERRTEPRRDQALGHAPYPQRPPRRGGAWLGWLLFVVVVAALLAAAWHFRAEIVAEVPETAEIYRALDIPVAAEGEGLEISGVTSVRRTVGGERRMVVSGSVVNVSGGMREVPMLRAVISDAAGQEVLTWEFAATSRRLDPGAVATFETSTANPPENGSLRVEFAGSR
jgi:predicted Zn finger-like uncharacterized protein